MDLDWLLKLSKKRSAPSVFLMKDNGLISKKQLEGTLSYGIILQQIKRI